MASYYISPTGNDSTGNGSSGNPWATLAKAIASSATADTINVAAGSYLFVTTSITDRTITGPSFTTGLPVAVFDAGGTSASWRVNIGGGTAVFNNIRLTNFTNNTGIAVINGSGSGSPETITFNNCSIDSGTAGDNVNVGNGGILIAQGNMAINCNRCLIANITGNSTMTQPIYALRQNATPMIFTNCTLRFNDTGSYRYTYLCDNGFPVFKNCIIQNDGTNMDFDYRGLHPTWTYTDCYNINDSTAGTGVIHVDAQLVDADNLNFNLRPTSPCINTGSL